MPTDQAAIWIPDGQWAAPVVLHELAHLRRRDNWRILADQAFRRVLLKHGTRSEAAIHNVPMVWSGGCDGVITPHATVFARNSKTGPASKARLVMGTAMSAVLLPEDIGRPAMVDVSGKATTAREATLPSLGNPWSYLSGVGLSAAGTVVATIDGAPARTNGN